MMRRHRQASKTQGHGAAAVEVLAARVDGRKVLKPKTLVRES
jgi:hypothetical protein